MYTQLNPVVSLGPPAFFIIAITLVRVRTVVFQLYELDLVTGHLPETRKALCLLAIAATLGFHGSKLLVWAMELALHGSCSVYNGHF